MTTSSQSSEAQKTFTKACVSAFDNAFGVSPAPPRDTKFLGRDITVNVGNPMRFEIGDPTLERRPGQNSGPPSVFDTKIGDFLVPFLIHPVFVWAPELLWRSLVPGIPCPKCNRTSTVKFQKWNHPPRRVYTIGGHYYLIGESTVLVFYKCASTAVISLLLSSLCFKYLFLPALFSFPPCCLSLFLWPALLFSLDPTTEIPIFVNMHCRSGV